MTIMPSFVRLCNYQKIRIILNTRINYEKETYTYRTRGYH